MQPVSTVTELPSTGIPLARLSKDARTLDLPSFVALYAPAFFVRHAASSRATLVPMRTQAVPSAEATGEIIIVAHPIRRRPTSEHPFVAIGRLEGNDVALVDETVSKFHAYVKEQDHGFVVQDARSRNGTTVEGAPVAGRGLGPPTPLVSGQTVRFGSVTTTFLDAAAVVALATRLSRG